MRRHDSGGSRPRTAPRPRSRTAAPRTTPAAACTRRNSSVIAASRPHSACQTIRRAVHERLGAGVVARRAALDEVRGEGERRAGEADQRGAAELADQQPYRLVEERDVLGVQRPDRGHVGLGLHRLGHDRADAGLDVEVDAGGGKRHHDVGEEDRRVDPVPADRLQGDLADQRRVAAGVEHRRLGPDRAVLGQRPAGLTHEPHRRVRDRLPPARQRPARTSLGAVGRWHGIHRWQSCHVRALARQSGANEAGDRPSGVDGA